MSMSESGTMASGSPVIPGANGPIATPARIYPTSEGIFSRSATAATNAVTR
jgi:hypothetical protein